MAPEILTITVRITPAVVQHLTRHFAIVHNIGEAPSDRGPAEAIAFLILQGIQAGATGINISHKLQEAATDGPR